MNAEYKSIFWKQFGASIDTLEGAIKVCPDDMWSDRSRDPVFWQLAFHTLFWLDLYLTGSIEGFSPPEPFGLEELDPSGTYHDPPYTKEQLLTYVMYCRDKCKTTIESLDDTSSSRICEFRWGNATFTELLLYNMRHVQHGAAQLNVRLRQEADTASRWIGRAAD
jgi:hypothetical protein